MSQDYVSSLLTTCTVLTIIIIMRNSVSRSQSRIPQNYEYIMKTKDSAECRQTTLRVSQSGNETMGLQARARVFRKEIYLNSK